MQQSKLVGCSDNFFKVALLAINNLGAVGGVAGFKGVGAETISVLVLASVLISFGWGLTPAKLALALALALPELEEVALLESLVVATVGAEPRQGQIHSAIELQLLGDDAEGLGALFIASSFMAVLNILTDNDIFYIFDTVW